MPLEATFLRLRNLTALPGTAAALHGLTTLADGRTLPVVDLARLLGCPSSTAPDLAVLLRQGRDALVVPVQDVWPQREAAPRIDLPDVWRLASGALGLVDVGGL